MYDHKPYTVCDGWICFDPSTYSKDFDRTHGVQWFELSQCPPCCLLELVPHDRFIRKPNWWIEAVLKWLLQCSSWWVLMFELRYLWMSITIIRVPQYPAWADWSFSRSSGHTVNIAISWQADWVIIPIYPIFLQNSPNVSHMSFPIIYWPLLPWFTIHI